MTTKNGTDTMPTDPDDEQDLASSAEHADESTWLGDDFYRAARAGERAPSALYDDCRTAADVNARFKEALMFAEFVYGPHKWTAPEWKAVRNMLGEEMRLAHVRTHRPATVVAQLPDGTTVPMSRITRRRSGWTPPEIVVDKDDTITCVGVCGKRLPATKFPTVTHHGPGARAAECRACRDARRADEQKVADR